MFSTCSELTPRAPIPDGRMERIMQPWSEDNDYHPDIMINFYRKMFDLKTARHSSLFSQFDHIVTGCDSRLKQVAHPDHQPNHINDHFYFFIFIFSFLPSDWLGLITFITMEQNECRRVCADYTPPVRTLLNVQGGLSADIFVSVLPYFTKKVNFSIDKGSIW